MSKQLNTTIRGGLSLRTAAPMTNDQIRSVCPSIFASEAHQDRSQRYSYIPTIDVVEALRKEGFYPFFVAQATPRIEDRFAFAKHMIRMRHASSIGEQETNEIILVNSHDGTTSYQMLAGVFRFVCENGMVCGDIVDDIRVRHTGRVIDDVIEGSYSVLNQFEKVDDSKESMKLITLQPSEQRLFANAALELKYESSDAAPITSDAILRPRRYEDKKDDLWTVFNRTQEALISGGLRGRSESGRRMTTRPVNGIGDNVKLNKALWSLTEGMKALKQ